MGFFTPVTEQPISPWTPYIPTVTNTIFGDLPGSPTLTIPEYVQPSDPVVPAVVAPDTPNNDVENPGDGGKPIDYDPYEMDGFLDKNGPYHPYDKEYWGGTVRPSQFDQESFFGKLHDTIGFMKPGIEALGTFNKLGGMLTTPMGPVGLLGMALGAQPTSMLNSWNEPVMQAQLQQTWSSLTPEMQETFGSFKSFNATGLGMFGTGNSMKPGYNEATIKSMDLIGVQNVEPVDFAMRNRIDAIAATRGWNMAGLAEVGKAPTALSYSGMKAFNSAVSAYGLKSIDYVANAHISDMASFTGSAQMKETAALVTSLGLEAQLTDMIDSKGNVTSFGKQMGDITASLKDNLNSSIHNQTVKDVMNNPTATLEEKQTSFADWANAKLSGKVPDYIGNAIQGIDAPSIQDLEEAARKADASPSVPDPAVTSTETISPSLVDSMNANAAKFGWGGLAGAVSQVNPSFGTSWEGLMSGNVGGDDSSSGGYDRSGDRSGLNDRSAGGGGSRDGKAEASRDSSRADGPNGEKSEGRHSGMS